MATYSYSIASDTADGKVDLDQLSKEIQDSAIVTALDYISTDGDDLDIEMKASLSTGDETILDGIVSAHDGINTAPGYYAPSIPDDAMEKRLYKQVSAYDSDTLDYTIPNGKLLRLYEFGGSGARSSDIKVEVIWDATGTPEKLFTTHDAIAETTRRTLTGNGTKKLRIKLTNDSGQSESIGAYWIGREE